MWFLTARKARLNLTARSERATFRPHFDALEDRCLLSAGALDLTFGTSGKVFGPLLPGSNSTATAAVLAQPDGKVLAGGAATGADGNADFALARYNANGSLDTSFNGTGIASTVIGPRGSSIAGLALQSDGKIIAVGVAQKNVVVRRQLYSAAVIVVARYNSDGSLDKTFGGGTNPSGIVINSPNNSDAAATAVAIQADGKIDVGAYSAQLNGQGVYTQDFTLARYNSNGTLDTTFGPQKTGMVVTPQFGIQPDSGDRVTSMTVQADGKIIMAGSTNAAAYMAVARYTSGGLLDTSFNGSGIVTRLAPPGFSFKMANGVVVQNSGAIVVGGNSWIGTSAEEMTLLRLTSTGQVDTTFGSAGFVVNSNMLVSYGIVQSANGDLLTAGTVGLLYNTSTTDFGVAAYLPNGTPDTSFGNGGIATADFSGGSDKGRALALQADGKIVVAGLSTPPGGNFSTDTRIALARFLPPNAKIGSFTGSSAAGSVTLTASNILNSNPTSSISQVNFYLQNPDLSLTLLGTGTNSSGTWTLTFAEATYGLTSGNTYTFVAQAVDSNGVLSDPLAISLQVL